MNYEKRRGELEAITSENEKLLSRIQGRRPFKVTADLEADYAQSTVYGNITTRYPEPLPEIDSAGVDDDFEEDETAGETDTGEATPEGNESYTDTQELQQTQREDDSGKSSPEASNSGSPDVAANADDDALQITQQGESSSDPVKELEEAE